MTAGSEEHEPLITSSVDQQRVTYNNSPQDGNSPGDSPRASGGELTLAIPQQRNYGAIGGAEKVTYTWADVNAFATETRSRNRKFWNLWRGSNDRMFQQRKQLLRNVNGAAYPGELLAIMGSSGAGKTTLLNALTFRTPSGVVSSGTRALNGQPATPEALTALSAYVQQQDLFIGTLTVKEHLIFQLALSKCQNTVIGIPGRLKGISGGEMKRLSFASEVLTDPPLMFCDEPTSGLDSFMAQNVLSGLAKKGKTVVCTIHQPSSELYAMFDKLLIMADGRVAFLGSPEQATEFFKELGAACPANYNPADHYIQLLAGVPGREETTRHTIDTRKITQGWADSAWSSAAAMRVRRSPYKASWCAQFRAVLWRSWLSVTKEPMLIKVRFLQTIMVSILIGVIYFGQNLDQDGVFCSELPIFIREHHSGMYRADVYFLSKTLAEAPVFATIPLVFTTVAYYMIGYLISCASSSVSMAASVGPPIIIPFMLFGGFFLNSGSVPPYLGWISYLSWFRYGNEALLINQWTGVESIACTRENFTCPASGKVVLETLSFSEMSKTVNESSGQSASNSDTSRADYTESQELQPADIIYVDGGLRQSKFEEPFFADVEDLLGTSSAPRPCTLVWRDVTLHIKPKDGKLKRLVNGVNGIAKAGSLVALMGPSGAGKTTLMSALAHRNPTEIVVDGEITMNGRQVGDFMHQESGYMHQDELFVENLTVIEHLSIMARLRMDRRTTSLARKRRVNQLLRQLSLYGLRYTRIGGLDGRKTLSGGERKRLAFATELLTDPGLLFCDEPTTGLDSSSAQKMMTLLRANAVEGKTVICTIHQPSSELMALFDKLVLLAEGRVAYAGNASGALSFFESLGYHCPITYNPTDYFIKVLALTPGSESASRHAIKSICDRFAVSDAAKELDMEIHLEYHLIDNQDQFLCTVLSYDDSMAGVQVHADNITGPQSTIITNCSKIAGLCFIGTAHLTQAGIQDVQGALFIIIAENTFSPMYSVLHMFPEEFPMLHRELWAGLYSTPTYYIARMIAMFPGLLVEPTLFTLVVYWIAGLRTTLYAFSFTVFISILVLNVAIACACIPDEADAPCLSTGDEVLSMYDFTTKEFWPDIIALIILYVIFHLLALIALRYRTRRK
ncbi:unnamed protein product [Leptidea sinapis]|uniref:ABC transporter domain-containing protein n=1 Tax=Leptidea sinapis TaxID=189913 RepID=A0A5E4QQ28_9NEOP|nr:unnamed protein product [Leptidea sinapis]